MRLRKENELPKEKGGIGVRGSEGKHRCKLLLSGDMIVRWVWW